MKQKEFLIHSLCWIIIICFPMFFFGQGENFGVVWPRYVRAVGGPLSYMIVFYANYLWLVPKYLLSSDKRKFRDFFVANLLLIVVAFVNPNFFVHRNILDIMAALGKNTTPTIKEVEFINRWFGTYSFSKEMILAACERTVMKTDSDRFAYAEGILSRWKEQGLTNLQQVEAAEADFKKKKNASLHPAAQTPKVSFQKSKYDFAALQKFINES